jgi:hypothetical protein
MSKYPQPGGTATSPTGDPSAIRSGGSAAGGWSGPAHENAGAGGIGGHTARVANPGAVGVPSESDGGGRPFHSNTYSPNQAIGADVANGRGPVAGGPGAGDLSGPDPRASQFDDGAHTFSSRDDGVCQQGAAHPSVK